MVININTTNWPVCRDQGTPSPRWDIYTISHPVLARVGDHCGRKYRKSLRDAQMYVSCHDIHPVEGTTTKLVLTMMTVPFFLCLTVNGGGQEVGNSRQSISPRIGLYCVHFHHLFCTTLDMIFLVCVCVCLFIFKQ